MGFLLRALYCLYKFEAPTHRRKGRRIQSSNVKHNKKAFSAQPTSACSNYLQKADPISQMDEALKPYTPVLLYTHMLTGCNTCLTFHKVTGDFIYSKEEKTISVSSVAQSCPTLCDPMNRSMPGLAVHHQLPEFIQTHVHRVSESIQPSHPLSSPSPPALNPSQH